MIHFRSAEIKIFTVTGEESYSERKLCDGGVVKISADATEYTAKSTGMVTCPACEQLIQRTLHYLKAIDEDVELGRYTR